MKKLLIPLLLILFTVPALANAVWNFNAANTKLNAASNPMIVLPGDSNFSRIPTGFDIPGYQVVKWGESGANSKDLVRGLPLVIWTKTPEICIYMIGTNDAYGQNQQPEIQPSYYKVNVKMALVLLKDRCARVIFFGLPPTRDRVNISAWTTAAQEAASEMGVQYFPLTEAMFPPSAFGDDVHFNASGYAILRQAMIDAIAASYP